MITTWPIPPHLIAPLMTARSSPTFVSVTPLGLKLCLEGAPTILASHSPPKVVASVVENPPCLLGTESQLARSMLFEIHLMERKKMTNRKRTAWRLILHLGV